MESNYSDLSRDLSARFDPSPEYLPFLMLRYAITSLLLLRLLQRDDEKKHKF